MVDFLDQLLYSHKRTYDLDNHHHLALALLLRSLSTCKSLRKVRNLMNLGMDYHIIPSNAYKYHTFVRNHSFINPLQPCLDMFDAKVRPHHL